MWLGPGVVEFVWQNLQKWKAVWLLPDTIIWMCGMDLRAASLVPWTGYWWFSSGFLLRCFFQQHFKMTSCEGTASLVVSIPHVYGCSWNCLEICPVNVLRGQRLCWEEWLSFEGWVGCTHYPISLVCMKQLAISCPPYSGQFGGWNGCSYSRLGVVFRVNIMTDSTRTIPRQILGSAAQNYGGCWCICGPVPRRKRMKNLEKFNH